MGFSRTPKAFFHKSFKNSSYPCKKTFELKKRPQSLVTT
ncbi:hypothetical protein ADIS_4601 [Lunatimonas lonarensis]|uniref:Uncharacterized protein n=1 Tax=Lunatimonas lonarensis TaxID=1232681 RepID=R7ZLF8_9BACT|nr:hypothetical protein ADIS_4601 [Lunatimonas lonarensis]